MYDYLLFDLETTCWETDYPKRQREIIEIGAIMLDQYGKELSRYRRFVRPEIHPYLSFYCSSLTNIQQPDVGDAPNFSTVHKEFSNWVESEGRDFIYVTWGGYDEEIVNQACDHANLETLINGPYLDAKLAYHSIKKLNYKLGLKKALRYEGLEFEGEHHRALPDTLNLARLFRRYLGEWPV